jgi:hypothetical protein
MSFNGNWSVQSNEQPLTRRLKITLTVSSVSLTVNRNPAYNPKASIPSQSCCIGSEQTDSEIISP